MSAKGKILRRIGRVANNATWSPDGQYQVLVLSRAGNTEVRLTTASGRTLRSTRFSGLNDVQGLGWAAALKTFAYLRHVPGGGSELHVVGVGEADRLLARSPKSWWPAVDFSSRPTRAWSQDGSRILVGPLVTTVPYAAGPAVDISTSDEWPTYSLGIRLTHAVWAGNDVVYSAARPGMDAAFSTLRAASGDGTNRRILTPSSFESAEVSPTGEFVALARRFQEGLELRDLAGNLVGSAGGSSPCGWSPDEQLLAVNWGVLRRDTFWKKLVYPAGATTCSKWSPDSTRMLTDDGLILRVATDRTKVELEGPAYAADTWGPP